MYHDNPHKHFRIAQNKLGERIRNAKEVCRKGGPFSTRTFLAEEGVLGKSTIFEHVRNLKMEYRCRHIALCLLRGTPREKIETPAEFNQPVEPLVKAIHDATKDTFKEYHTQQELLREQQQQEESAQ